MRRRETYESAAWSGTKEDLRNLADQISSFFDEAKASAASKRDLLRESMEGVPRSVKALLELLYEEREEAAAAAWQTSAEMVKSGVNSRQIGDVNDVLNRLIDEQRVEELTFIAPASASASTNRVMLRLDKRDGARLEIEGDEQWVPNVLETLRDLLDTRRPKPSFATSPIVAMVATAITVVGAIGLWRLVAELLESVYARIEAALSTPYALAGNVEAATALISGSYQLLAILLFVVVIALTWPLAYIATEHAQLRLLPRFEVLTTRPAGRGARTVAAVVSAVSALLLSAVIAIINRDLFGL